MVEETEFELVSELALTVLKDAALGATKLADPREVEDPIADEVSDGGVNELLEELEVDEVELVGTQELPIHCACATSGGL